MKIFSNGVNSIQNFPKKQKPMQPGFKGNEFILAIYDPSKVTTIDQQGAVNGVVFPLAQGASDIGMFPSENPPRFTQPGQKTTMYETPDTRAYSWLTPQQEHDLAENLTSQATDQLTELEQQGKIQQGTLSVQLVPWKQAHTVEAPGVTWD